jgi:glycosyltransferase involved in cell wall biosynthesis
MAHGSLQKPLVSIIIPCYNGERFLREAIDSCLAQTYRPIEIIVVDDGSTDGSMDIVRSYGDAVICETGPNRGPSHARNRGFELSSGQYIQYLDVDDYLMPTKLAIQVSLFESGSCDVVYGNWRVLYHTPNDDRKFSQIQTFGTSRDIKESLLSTGWLATATPLFKREIVVKAGGWDENIRAVEEKDFHFSVALMDGSFLHHADWVSVFRRYGAVTLSTSNLALWTQNAYILFRKMEQRLQNANMLTDRYREALAVSYYSIARRHYERSSPVEYRRALANARRVCPGFEPRQSALYNGLQKVFGMDAAQRVAYYKRKAQRFLIPRRGLKY